MRSVRLHFCVLCFYLSFHAVESGQVEYDLSQRCNEDLYVYDSALLTTPENWWNVPGGKCRVRVFSMFNNQGYEKVRLEVLSMDVACSNNHLQLFDGRDGDGGTPLSSKMCGSSSFQTMFITHNRNYMTIDLISDLYLDLPFSLKLLVTATSTSGYDTGVFICDNLFYIKSDLKCDGYNNCGDWSDEASYLCDIMSRPLEIGVIAASCTVCVGALLVTICIVVKSRRRRQGLVGPNAGVAQGPPFYDSIQQGVNPGFFPPPPPYFSKTGPMPPPPSYHGVAAPPPLSSQPTPAAPAPATAATTTTSINVGSRTTSASAVASEAEA